MAAARRSENIEVQHGDPDYENDTTVTARRTSQEGHYESLDLHTRGDDVYGDLRTKPSGRSPFRVAVIVAGCLGMLCFGLAGGITGLGVSYHTLSLENTDLTRERDQIKSFNTNLTQERDQLQREVNQLKNQTADRSCPGGWEKFGRSCYYRNTEFKTWQEGRDECRSLGADLVIINSGEKKVFIDGLGRAGGYGSWIGLTRTEGSWTWVDGTPLTTTYWYSGSPKGSGVCAMDLHRTGHGTWSNVLCAALGPTICEK